MIKLPNNFMGKPIKGSLERVLAQAEKGIQPDPDMGKGGAGQPMAQLPAQFIPQNYVFVGTNPRNSLPVYIAKEIILKGSNWNDTHYSLAASGLFMPTPWIMTNHFLNVKHAAEGKGTLYDGGGSPVSSQEVSDLWDYLSLADSNYRNSKGVCWTWLDAYFKVEPQTGTWFMETNHRVVSNGTQKEIQCDRVQLGAHYQQSGLVKLNFSTDGLATDASPHNQYTRGENMYYWRPENDKVAGFYANSVRADLGCDGDPAVVDDSLGVFACAEGTASQK